MSLEETFVAIFAIFVAIVAFAMGCVMLVKVAQYGAKALGGMFGTDAADVESLGASEVEDMIRRAVREEVHQEVRPLQEKIERLERQKAKEPAPRRDLPEDPHDFGLIAERDDAREEHAA